MHLSDFKHQVMLLTILGKSNMAAIYFKEHRTNVFWGLKSPNSVLLEELLDVLGNTHIEVCIMLVSLC